MKHHPEQQDDEIYMGNWDREKIETDWKTLRLGIVPHGSDGEPLNHSHSRPGFVKISEVQRKIDSVVAENKPWSAEIVRTLQPMIDQRTRFVDTAN